jgi:hypothetical protein
MSFVKLKRILGPDETSVFFFPVFRIRDVFFVSGSGSFLQWLSRCQQKESFSLKFFLLITYSSKFTSVFKDSKLLISHKTVEIQVYLNFLACCWNDTGSGSVQIITDPDPGGLKAYGTGSGTLLFPALGI